MPGDQPHRRSRRHGHTHGDANLDCHVDSDGYGDSDAYLLNPPAFLPNLAESHYLDQYRRNKFVLATGEWDICRKANEDFSGLLGAKGIPHSLHVWGFGSKHDWPDWQPMASAYLP